MASPLASLVHKALLAVGVVVTAVSSLRAEVRPLGVLPLNSNPTRTLIEGQDGFLYGVLMETNSPNPQFTCGAVYQVSPTGSIRFLHSFPVLHTTPTPNVGGAIPSQVLAMGKDGFLYGLTCEGGAHGYGIFYRLSTDGTFEVIADVPPYMQLAHAMNSWLLGPDGALYGYSFSSAHYPGETPAERPLNIVRFGLEGSVSTIFNPSPRSNSGYRIEPLNDDHRLIRVSWVESHKRYVFFPVTEFGRKGIAHEVVLELPSGNVVSQHEFPFLTGLPEAPDTAPYLNHWAGARFFSTRPEGWLFCSDYYSRNQIGIPNRILSLNPQGQVTVLANYGTHIANPDIPSPAHLLHAADGTIYFTSGDQKKGSLGIFGGTKIYQLKPGQTPAYQQLVDLDGYPIAALTESREGHLYGISWGPVAIGIGEDLNEDPEDVNPDERTAQHAPRDTRARATAEKPRGAFRRTNPKNAQLAPIARSDRLVLPARRSAPAVKAFVLRNDVDPAKGLLTISAVSTPQHGTATIQPADGKQLAHIVYTPTTWPRQSEVLTYTVANAQGNTAVGQLRIRANLAASFRGTALASTGAGAATPISLDSLTLNLRPTGKFSGSLKVNGQTLPLSGLFNDTNSVSLTRRWRGADRPLSIRLSLESVDGVRQLRYTVSCLGEALTGTLAAR